MMKSKSLKPLILAGIAVTSSACSEREAESPHPNIVFILADMDGVSLIPELTGKEGQKEHEYLYFEFQELGGRQAVRKGDWKLVHMNIRGDDDWYELYNLREDPGETRDLIGSRPEKFEELEAIMKEAHVPNPDFPILREEFR